MRLVSLSPAGLCVSKSTLPLAMNVATFSKPCFSKQALSSAILIRLLPPTLIPRRSATNWVIPERLLPSDYELPADGVFRENSGAQLDDEERAAAGAAASCRLRR